MPSAVVIVFGTVFASGLYRTDLSACNPMGIAASVAASELPAGLLVAMAVIDEPIGPQRADPATPQTDQYPWPPDFSHFKIGFAE